MDDPQSPPSVESQPQSDFFIDKRDAIEKISFVKELLAWFGENIASPNQITSSRVLAVAPAIAIQTIAPIISTTVYSISLLLDWFDGAVARAMKNGVTKEGAMLDPLIDKIGNITFILTQLVLNYDNPVFIAGGLSTIGADIYSQVKRGDPFQQVRDGIRGTFDTKSCEVVQPDDSEIKKLQAVTQGKFKFALQSAAVLATVLREHVAATYEWVVSVVDAGHSILPTMTPDDVPTLAGLGFAGATVLALWGTAKRAIVGDNSKEK